MCWKMYRCASPRVSFSMTLALQYWFIFKLKNFGAAKTVTYLYVLWLCLNYQYLQRTLIFYHFHYTTKPHVNNNRERMRGTKLGHLCNSVGWMGELVDWLCEIVRSKVNWFVPSKFVINCTSWLISQCRRLVLTLICWIPDWLVLWLSRFFVVQSQIPIQT